MAVRNRGMHGYPKEKPFAVTLRPERLREPLGFKGRKRIFVCSMGDLFHQEVPFEFIAAVFGVMAGTPRHTCQILTKRPERMHLFFRAAERRLFSCGPLAWQVLERLSAWAHKLGVDVPTHHGGSWPLPNVWLGVSVEGQKHRDRIDTLCHIPAALRFVSFEPLLSDIGGIGEHLASNHVDWIITGGETGPGARPMDLDWARALRDQCREAGVPFFYKGAGTATMRKKDPEYMLLDGRAHHEMPKTEGT